jgi:hypothetical protein
MHGKTEEAKKTLKFMYPNRTEEDRKLLYAEYEYTLNQEAEKTNLVSINSSFRASQMTHSFILLSL